MDTSDLTIHVSNLCKEFKLYDHPSDMFGEMISGRARHRSFWALQDISFKVYSGQAVGLLGRNGAGKSTLLKIISGTLDKTSGEVYTKGRISSILELGTGFNGEYTGRENIYLGGLMIGLNGAEIKEKEDWIIEFSELRNFIDQPFKTYSSGMQARLTFATAVCVDPDILIIDEALSVGDARFARKSFAQMEEFRKEGKTILLVSHNSNQVASFCDYGLILEHGRVYDSGEPSRLRGVYYNLLFGKEASDEKHATAPPVLVEETPINVELDGAPKYELEASLFKPELGFCWQFDLTALALPGDSSDHPLRSSYILCEDQVPLGPPHSLHDSIRKVGNGHYSHWNSQLLFSSSDNSSPTRNGKTYTLRRKDTLAVESTVGSANPERLEIRNSALKKLGLNHTITEGSKKLLRYVSGKAEILGYAIIDENAKRVSYLRSGAKYAVVYYIVFYENLDKVSTGFTVNTIQGMELYGINSIVQNKFIEKVKKGSIVKCTTNITMWLTNGIYF